MIAGIRGQLVKIDTDAAIIDLHGLLIRVLSSSSSLSDLGSPGDSVELQTYLQVREDSLTLFGFTTSQELTLFELLLSVNGVGPRVALNMLSFSDPGSLYDAIANEDVQFLSRVPGIGKVTAGRIILDLKRKLPDDFAVASVQTDDLDRDALDALMALGYSAAEARAGLSDVPDRSGMSVEERIFAALQQMDQN